MLNYYYTDANGQKQGPFNEQQLQTLAAQRSITPQTILETDAGHKGAAGQIPGLNFNTVPVPPIINTQKISDYLGVKSASSSPLSRFAFIFLGTVPFTGMVGAHDFYAKRMGWGTVHLACFVPWILVFCFWTITSLLMGLGITIEVDWFNSSSSSDLFSQNPGRSVGWASVFLMALPSISYALAILEIVFVTEDGTGRELERF